MQMHSSQCLFIKFLKIADSSIQAMQLIKDPKSHDHSSPEITTVVIYVIDKPKSHIRVEILVRNVRNIGGMYFNVGDDLLRILLLKAKFKSKFTMGFV
jgi:hypothetical protein